MRALHLKSARERRGHQVGWEYNSVTLNLFQGPSFLCTDRTRRTMDAETRSA